MRKALVASIVVLAAASVAAYVYYGQHGPERGIEATVARVIDGDTIELANHDVVRLVGMDTPEHDQPYFNEATDALKSAVEGKVIRMEIDRTNKDRYGRYLRYVYVDGKFVNMEMVQNGFAFAYVVAPDNRYEQQFLEAENTARTQGLGIWAKSEYADCVSLKTLHYNAAGDDTANLDDEYFVITNSCGTDLQADGWSVRNEYNSFWIPNFTFPDGSDARIVSGNGSSGAPGIYMSSDRPIWNNNGDSLYLRDGSSRVILEKFYKNE